MARRAGADGGWQRRVGGGLLVLAALVLFAVVAYRNAWVCDDAYITFRVIDNWANGHGLRWNVAERVQAYTHPLWMFLVAGLFALTHEFYYTSIALSVALAVACAAAIGWMGRRDELGSAVAVLALACSKAVVDYSTSGLENPLTHLLIALFAVLLRIPAESRWRLLALSGTAALAGLNRLDALLLFLPLLLVEALRAADLRRALTTMAVGFAPLLAWEVFSIVYYGFPFPNTAYAKLNLALPQSALARQALHYFGNSLWTDPLTLGLIGTVGISVVVVEWRRPAAERDRITIALAIGVLLYLLYMFRIGGDFMSGRFFSAPFVLSLCIALRLAERIPRPALGLAAGGVLLAGLLNPVSPLRSGADYQEVSHRAGRLADEHGISDERGAYYPENGLLRVRALPERLRDVIPPHRWARQGLAARGQEIAQRVNPGLFGFYAGPGVHVIDVLALGDPLLARLQFVPHGRGAKWRVGHYPRPVPEGYGKTLRSGLNAIEDPAIAAYYDKLALVTRGPVFGLARLREIAKLNLGVYDPLLEGGS